MIVSSSSGGGGRLQAPPCFKRSYGEPTRAESRELASTLAENFRVFFGVVILDSDWLTILGFFVFISDWLPRTFRYWVKSECGQHCIKMVPVWAESIYYDRGLCIGKWSWLYWLIFGTVKGLRNFFPAALPARIIITAPISYHACC